jgi:SAM-dependent methyltransferase
MGENISEDWFSSWFDSPYYHQLYENRNDQEAEHFIENLLSYLKLAPKSKLLDLACGKGRHAITMAHNDFDVIGVDLAPQSIAEARILSGGQSNLRFDVHDMREVYVSNNFDVIFNLFTSFGYFDSEEDNVKMLQSIASMLLPKGLLVLDFFNAEKVIANLVPSEIIKKEGVVFDVQRRITSTHVYKDIIVHPKNQNEPLHFREQVQLFRKEDFERLLSLVNLRIIDIFGDFNLSEYNPTTSDRLILIAQKN